MNCCSYTSDLNKTIQEDITYRTFRCKDCFLWTEQNKLIVSSFVPKLKELLAVALLLANRQRAGNDLSERQGHPLYIKLKSTLTVKFIINAC